jgi:hypothetical protein
MKIIWADHDPSWGIPDKEESMAELAETKEPFRSGASDEASKDDAQEKGSWKEPKGFG